MVQPSGFLMSAEHSSSCHYKSGRIGLSQKRRVCGANERRENKTWHTARPSTRNKSTLFIFSFAIIFFFLVFLQQLSYNNNNALCSASREMMERVVQYTPTHPFLVFRLLFVCVQERGRKRSTVRRRRRRRCKGATLAAFGRCDVAHIYSGPADPFRTQNQYRITQLFSFSSSSSLSVAATRDDHREIVARNASKS